MDKANDLDLQQRVELIERLVSEGRHGSEAYGWVFVLWGLGHAICLTLDCVLPRSEGNLPWAVLMPLCLVIMGVVSLRRRQRRRVRTTVGRAIGMGWLAATVPMSFATFLQDFAAPPHDAAGIAHDFISFCLIIGIPNMASGLILRWGSQIAVAILWWCGAVAFAFVSTMPQLVAVSFALIVICEIAFGLHLMQREALSRRAAVHV